MTALRPEAGERGWTGGLQPHRSDARGSGGSLERRGRENTEARLSDSQRAYEAIAAEISTLIQSKYDIGDRLPAERDLAARFGVSRPTIREALLRLSLSGQVEVRKNSGVYVTGRQAKVVLSETGAGPFENLDARLIIEPELAAIAAANVSDRLIAQLADTLAIMRHEYALGKEAESGDHRFHLAIASASGNATLVNIVDMLWTTQLNSRIWQEIHRSMPMQAYWQTWLEDHEKIFDAIKAGNAKAARQAMARHIKNIHAILLSESSPARRLSPSAPGKP